MAPLTAEMLKTKATDLRDGRKYIGLGCLGQISNELSCAELKIDENQVEGLGRKLWATQEGTSATQQPYEGDTFWSENKVSFLAAWPEKAQLPIGIRDAGVLPKCGKFRLLALDEVVLSFWKFVGHVAAKKEQAEVALRQMGGRPGGESPDERLNWDEESTKLSQVITECEEQLDKARLLQRNVPFSLIYVASQEAREKEALSLREDTELFREYCGLSGWNKILVIGRKRDHLRDTDQKCEAAHVAEALKSIRWGPGREVTKYVAAKALQIYNKFAHVPAIVDIILAGYNRCGRQSVFEHYSILLLMVGGQRSIEETIWIMEQFLDDQVNGKTDAYSKSELAKKTSPLNVLLLRRKTVHGVLSQYIDVAIQTCREALSVKPTVKSTMEALEKFKAKHTTVGAYCKAQREKQLAPPDKADSESQELPPWCSVKVGKILRQTMDGSRDRIFVGMCSPTIKGGVSSITFNDHIAKQEGFAAILEEIAKDVEEWSASVNHFADGGTTNDSQTPPAMGGQSPTPKVGVGEQPAPEDAVATRISQIRQEVSDVSGDIRKAYVAVVPKATSVLASTQIIQASAVYAKVSDGTPLRICYHYGVPCAWALPRSPKSGTPSFRPVPLDRDDFAAFCEVIDKLITPENESYPTIFAGRAKRQGGRIGGGSRHGT